jgi:methylmalonyl-CoA mutase N-terminal domain/subunit
VDPLGGSYYLEYLTKTIETKVTPLMERVQQLGGARKAIESGFVHRQIQESAYKLQRSVDEGQTVIVGVNQFKEEEKSEVSIQRVSPSVERLQVQQLKKFKNSRNSAKAKSALSKLRSSALRDDNLLDDILRAVRSECTVGEISDLFRNAFGEYRVRLEV